MSSTHNFVDSIYDFMEPLLYFCVYQDIKQKMHHFGRNVIELCVCVCVLCAFSNIIIHTHTHSRTLCISFQQKTAKASDPN